MSYKSSLILYSKVTESENLKARAFYGYYYSPLSVLVVTRPPTHARIFVRVQRYDFSDEEAIKNEVLSKQKEKGSNLGKKTAPYKLSHRSG